MTRLLALETSSDVGSVALLIGDALAERRIATPREQTDTILPHVRALLDDAGIGLGDLDGVAFGRGPGSFTGLRVATTVAQGFGMALGVPLLPVSSLAAIAQGVFRAHGIRDCLVCVDARMGEVFWGRYAVAAGRAALDGIERLDRPGAVEAPGGDGWAAAGSGIAAHRAALAPLTARAAAVLPEAAPLARDLLPTALDDLAGGRAVPVEAALPVYLRREEAWRR